MTMRESKPQKSHDTWILVADGRQARIYNCLKTVRSIPLMGPSKHQFAREQFDHELVLLPDGIVNAPSIEEYQMGHDRRGSNISSADQAHNAFEPHGDIKEELKRRYLQALAEKLDHAFADEAFGHLILVAPAKMVGELRETLPPKLQSRVVAVLSKELTKYHGNELLGHLQDTLAEAYAA